MTEQEARALIEPYVYGADTESDYVLKYDVITLLMEHCQSSKRLEKIRGKIEERRLRKCNDATGDVQEEALRVEELEWVLSLITQIEKGVKE